ncbi:phage portal protein, HK97 family [Paenibacillus sp. UNCCL117]|uniref:phage portal protein n=1 Tax=unclassified Paenibacillus TaxID=185978 RepID=UPI00088BA146|nr:MULTISPECIES: phage portal protein [unclassified Paenibacillus]SDD27278.1 phage portal protein, HK97 family [Paenibacillus sp. cl123]SFW40568.1 phage portal protein, HK97 family [Paenibacillus sp. UNCCL117]
MKWGQRLKLAWNVVRNNVQGVGDGFGKWFFGGRSIFAGRSGNTLATNETIFAAVTRLSNSMASLPLKLYKEFDPIVSATSDMLANAPNNNMTGFDFIRTMETFRNVTGNAYALKMYDARYQVSSLLILDPSYVEPVVEQGTNELWYSINGDKGQYYVHNMDMIHVKHIHTTGYKGISPIDVLANTIEFDREVRKFSLDQMDTAIKASFILKMATHLGKEKKEEILENFKQFYKENGGVIIQESGVEVQSIDRKFIDTKVFEVEKITKSRVAMVFNIPLYLLGETDGVSYSSMEQLSLDYVTNTLVPIVRQYEQEFNRKLLTREERLRGLYFKFAVNALLRGDMQTRGEFYFKGIRSGLFKPNEVRAWEELPPEKGGEKLYISGDLYPIDTPVEQRKGVNKSEQTHG